MTVPASVLEVPRNAPDVAAAFYRRERIAGRRVTEIAQILLQLQDDPIATGDLADAFAQIDRHLSRRRRTLRR